VSDSIKAKRIKLIKILEDLKPQILTTNLEALNLATLNLANKYISSGLIPGKSRTDASHIAIAVINSLDALVSCKLELIHIVRKKL